VPSPVSATGPAVLDLDVELDRQVQTLLDKDYPALAGLDTAAFRAYVDPLHAVLADLPAPSGDNLPFVLVVRDVLVPTVPAVEAFEVRGKNGWTDMAEELPSYRPIEGVEVPEAPAYLLADVSTGPETLNVRPEDALPVILAAGRTPLTVDEGVAVVTQFPQVFAERNAFQALASRTGNRRVPSLWVSKGAPRLGWCWAGNPHTWFGAGSASARLSA
jgi:hypothetical protein